MARWWPRKWEVPVRSCDGGQQPEHLIGYEYAWWQWIKRGRAKYPFGPEPFDWRSIRISFRRPDDHWRNDDPPVRPRNRLLHRRSTRAQRRRYDEYMSKIAGATSAEEHERLTRELNEWLNKSR